MKFAVDFGKETVLLLKNIRTIFEIRQKAMKEKYDPDPDGKKARYLRLNAQKILDELKKNEPHIIGELYWSSFFEGVGVYLGMCDDFYLDLDGARTGTYPRVALLNFKFLFEDEIELLAFLEVELREKTSSIAVKQCHHGILYGI
jgi:hypothetical protein